jgi:hypothetical protein
MWRNDGKNRVFDNLLASYLALQVRGDTLRLGHYTGQEMDCGALGVAPVGWVIFTEVFVRPSKEPLGFCGSSLTLNHARAKRTV